MPQLKPYSPEPSQILRNQTIDNRVRCFVKWRTIAGFKTNMRSTEEFLQLERSGMAVAMDLCDDERRYLHSSLEAAEKELAERRDWVQRHEMEIVLLRKQASRTTDLQARCERMEDVVRRALQEERDEAPMIGWLKKLGTNTRMFMWSARWCELRKNVLCFWEERPSKLHQEAPKTTIAMAEIAEIQPSEKKPFAFKLTRTGYKDPIFLEESPPSLPCP